MRPREHFVHCWQPETRPVHFLNSPLCHPVCWCFFFIPNKSFCIPLFLNLLLFVWRGFTNEDQSLKTSSGWYWFMWCCTDSHSPVLACLAITFGLKYACFADTKHKIGSYRVILLYIWVILGRASHELPYVTSLVRSLGKLLIPTDSTNISKCILASLIKSDLQHSKFQAKWNKYNLTWPNLTLPTTYIYPPTPSTCTRQ